MSTRRPRARHLGTGAVVGVVSGMLTLGVAELLAALVAPGSSPVLATGAAFVDRTPLWLKDFAIRTFGVHDKLVLLLGIGVCVAALCAAAGILALRSAWRGVALVVVLGAVAALAAATRPGANALWPVPSLVGTLAGAVALRALAGLVTRGDPGGTAAHPRSSPDGSPAAAAGSRGGPPRRALIVGSVAGAGLLSAGAGRVLAARRSADSSRALVVLPAPAEPAAALPAGVDLRLDGLSPFSTAPRDFYRVDTALIVPNVSAQQWRLRVHGMVEREVELTFAELLDKPLIERWVTLACVSNPVGGDFVGNSRWLGYRLADLIRQAGPTAGADMLLATSVDGFTSGTPLSVVLDGRDAMLAVGMDGAPLPKEHGFPVRMVVPGLYGYVSACKWVVDIEVTRFDRARAYWTDRGWSAKAPIKTASRIDVPRSFAKVRAGTVPVAGVAWAQHRGIAAVQVRVDRGPWQQATLAATPGVDTWRQWRWAWEANAGQHLLEVRATDGDGQAQTGEVTASAPDGATGWDSVLVQVT